MAAKIGVCKQTLEDWAAKHPSFSYSVKKSLTYAQAWWEDAGQTGMGQGKDFNATVFIFQMKNRFRADYHDKHELEHKTDFGSVWQMIADRGKASDGNKD